MVCRFGEPELPEIPKAASAAVIQQWAHNCFYTSLPLQLQLQLLLLLLMTLLPQQVSADCSEPSLEVSEGQTPSPANCEAAFFSAASAALLARNPLLLRVPLGAGLEATM